MFKKDDDIYFINLYEGRIQKAKFLEYDKDGAWIKINGESINTFIYSDQIDERIFPEESQAQYGLALLRARMKARLLNNNYYIEDIISKLSKHEGAFYLELIREILEEKSRR